ncbi:MAG: divalent-cation tolerance protein CutA [Cyanobacteriota bacterium]
MNPWQPEAEALLVVSTTVAEDGAARHLARLALESRLAACVQVAVIESHYIWEGASVQEPERRLLFKTTVAAYPALERLLLAHHPYALPMVLAEPLVAVSAAYRAWVLEALTPGPISERMSDPEAAASG